MNAESLAQRIHDWLERETDVAYCEVLRDNTASVAVDMDSDHGDHEFVIIVEDA